MYVGGGRDAHRSASVTALQSSINNDITLLYSSALQLSFHFEMNTLLSRACFFFFFLTVSVHIELYAYRQTNNNN